MERIAVKMSRRYGFATASAVERIPMDNMVLLLKRGLGCMLLLDWITCACFIIVDSVRCLTRCFVSSLLTELWRERLVTKRRSGNDGRFFIIALLDRENPAASGVVVATRIVVSSSSRGSGGFRADLLLCRLVEMIFMVAASQEVMLSIPC